MVRSTHVSLTASCVLLLLGVLFPASAAAQDRKGFWFGIGGGYGSANVTCDDCGDSSRESSGAVYLKGGWTANPRVLVGGEFNVWAKKFAVEPGTDATVNIYNFSGTVTVYPAASGGFFVKGGGGVAFTGIDLSPSGTTISVDLGKGPGVIVGAGYDVKLGRRVALTPAVNFWYGSLGDLQVLGQTFASNWKQNVVDITIGVTFP